MYLFYRSNGDVIAACLRSDGIEIATSHLSVSEAIGIFELDEIEANQELIIDLLQTATFLNSSGQSKYYISGQSLFTRDGWSYDG